MDNSAIERIAANDLDMDAKALLKQYGANDDVVFFLGRLAWKGNMKGCVPNLLTIACDPARGRYARIAAIRAVMTLGDEEQTSQVWQSIVDATSPVDPHVLSEILKWTPPTISSVELVLKAIALAEPHKQFEVTGVEQAITEFIDRSPVMADEMPDQPLKRLVEGLNDYLEKEPYIERNECFVSQEFAWLIGPALHVVDKLVGARSAISLEHAAISIMLKVPAVRFWSGDHSSEGRSSLSENVPRWKELNDLLYWEGIDECRRHAALKGDTVTDERHISSMGHFWRFDACDFDRCLEWFSTKSSLDDKMVAVTRCLDLYLRCEQSADWKDRLERKVASVSELKDFLALRIDPKPSTTMQRMIEDRQKREKVRKKKDREAQKNRAAWIRDLKTTPDRIRCPSGVDPDTFTGDQYHLLRTLLAAKPGVSRAQGANWRGLIGEFGETVAEAYRDAAIASWRKYVPQLGSEGAKLNSASFALMFSLAGLAIEAGGEANFPNGLSAGDAKHAVRYATWELNGFPRWFEPLYHMHPEIVLAAVKHELLWELESALPGTPIHYILHDLVYHAPWMHSAIAETLLDWLSAHDLLNDESLLYSLNILTGGNTASADLSSLAANKLLTGSLEGQRPRWYALWVDNDPDAGIAALRIELAGLPIPQASEFAQQFITILIGGRYGNGKRSGGFQTVAHLKTLHLLMHEHIRINDDMKRTEEEEDSSTARENAQEARDSLLRMLIDVPGADAYAAIKALESEHPNPRYRNWMAKSAHRRAITDGDEMAWSDGQIAVFVQSIGASSS